MSSEDNFDTYKKGEEAREELKSNALKSAYEITAEIERITKTKLTFEQFDFIFKRTHEASLDGFISGSWLALQACREAIRGR